MTKDQRGGGGVTGDRREGGGVTGDRRGGGGVTGDRRPTGRCLVVQQGGATASPDLLLACGRGLDGIPESPPCLRAAAQLERRQ